MMRKILMVAALTLTGMNTVQATESRPQLSVIQAYDNHKALVGKPVEITDCQVIGYNKRWDNLASFDCVFISHSWKLFVRLLDVPEQQKAFGAKYCTDPLIWRPECKASITGYIMNWKEPSFNADGIK